MTGSDKQPQPMVLAEWTAHPARSRPRDLALAASVLFLTMGAVLVAFESPFLMILAAIILVIGISGFLFPTRYRITEDGIEERRVLHSKSRAWKQLKRVEVGSGAALVSPFSNPTWLDRYRGVIVMFDGADRDQVIGLLKKQIAEKGAKRIVSSAESSEGGT